MFYSYKKTVRTTSADGKTVEEVVEQTSGDEAKAKMDAMPEMKMPNLDDYWKKFDGFFKKMGEAFKELT